MLNLQHFEWVAQAGLETWATHLVFGCFFFIYSGAAG